MSCNINEHVRNKVIDAGRLFDVSVNETRLSTPKARKVVSEINNHLGFYGTRADNLGDNVSLIVENFPAIAAEISKQTSAHKELSRLDNNKQVINTENREQYQLLPDEQRKKINRRLELLMKQFLSKMGVTIESFDSYLSRYKKRHPGKDINMIAVADLYKNIVAISKDGSQRDGTTLAEETFHFIVDSFWDSPFIKDIRNLDSTGTGPDFKNTSLWIEESGKYRRIYNNDEMVEKEIIAKLLTRNIYDKFQGETLKDKVSKFLNNLLSKVLPRLAKKLKLVNETDVTVTEKLNEVLNEFNLKLTNETIKLEKREEVSGEIPETHSLFSEKAAREAIEILEARVKTLNERKLGLIDESLKDRYQELLDKLQPSSYQQLKKDLETLKAKSKLTIMDQERIREIEELLGLAKLKGLDEANADKIYNLNKRIKVINEQISKGKFEAGIFTFFFGPKGDGLNGAISDIDNILKYIEKVQTNEESISLIDYGMLIEAANFYSPVIKTLNNIYKSGFSFPELSQDRNKELSDVLDQMMQNQIPKIELFLKNQTADQIRKEFKKHLDFNPELENRINDTEIYLYEFGALNYAIGSSQNAKEDWLGLYHKKIIDTKYLSQSLTDKTRRGLTLEIGELISKIGSSGIKKLSEKDDSGKKSGYWLNKYKIWLFEKRREEEYNNIFKKLEEVSKKEGFNYKIPRDRTERHLFFSGDSMGALTKEEIKHIGKLKKLYSTYWANWFFKNTMINPDAEKIIESRRKSMNITQFNLWYSKNVREVELIDGEVVTMYTGELSIPSDGRNRTDYDGKTVKTFDYSNDEYDKLSTDEKTVLNALKKEHERARNFLPVSYSYESANRLPQVSQTFLDSAYRGLQGVGDKVTDAFIQKIDDPLFAERDSFGKIIERPRLRYISKLDDPEILSDDLFRSVMLFTDMSNNYHEFMKILPEIDAMIGVARNAPKKSHLESNMGQWGSKVARRLFTDNNDDGSTLVKKMEHLKKTLIQGEVVSRFDSKLANATSQFMQTLKSYVSSTNLLGNFTSAATGLGSAYIEKIIENGTKRYLRKEDTKFGILEVGKDMLNISSDINSRIKSSKISAMAEEMNLVVDLELNVSNLEKSKMIRRSANLAGWGMWRFADIMVKYPAMVGLANNMKSINGRLYTEESWKLTGNSKEKYDNAKSVWELVNFNDGVLSYNLSEQEVGQFKSMVRVVSSRLDSTLLEEDRGAIYNHGFFQLLTIHMGWLFQMYDRGFKSRHFNWQTGSFEMGYWVAFIKSLPNIHHIFTDFKDMAPEEKEGIKRIGLMMAATSLLFVMAYIMNGIELEGDDDEDPEVKYATYIITKMLLEQESRLSLSDSFRYLKSPTKGVDEIEDYFRMIFAPIYYIFDSNEKVESGIYKDYTVGEKNLIKAVPLLKGWFETMYGGYINEVLDKSSTSISTSIRAKNQYIKNNFLNGTPEIVLGLPFSGPIKMVTKPIAEPLAENFTTYSKSKNITAVPDKKSNEKK